VAVRFLAIFVADAILFCHPQFKRHISIGVGVSAFYFLVDIPHLDPHDLQTCGNVFFVLSFTFYNFFF